MASQRQQQPDSAVCARASYLLLLGLAALAAADAQNYPAGSTTILARISNSNCATKGGPGGRRLLQTPPSILDITREVIIQQGQQPAAIKAAPARSAPQAAAAPGDPAPAAVAAAAADPAALAASLEFKRFAPVDCWVLMTQRDPAAATATVNILQTAGPASPFTVVGTGNRPAGTHELPRRRGSPPIAAPVPAKSGPTTRSSSSSNVARPFDLPLECSNTPVNQACGFLWGMNAINATQVWVQLQKVPSATIAFKGVVNDEGVYLQHNDISPQLLLAESFTPPGSLPAGGNQIDPLYGHGTHVYGTMAGAWGAGDTRGIVGVLGGNAPAVASCNLLPTKPSAMAIPAEIMVDCLAHGNVSNTYHVSCNSWGFNDPLAPDDASVVMLKEGIDQHVCQKGGLFIASAGNGYCRDAPGAKCTCADPSRPSLCLDSSGFITGNLIGQDMSNINILADGTVATFNPPLKQYPAAFADELDCVIAVAASDIDNQLARFSNYGAAVGVTAPGVGILSDYIASGNGPGGLDPWAQSTLDGTSMAAPHVAGAALLLRNAFPAAAAADIKRCIVTSTAGKPSPAPTPAAQNYLVGGLLDVLAAFKCMQSQFGDGGSVGSLSCQDATSSVEPGACSSVPVAPTSLYTASSDVGTVTVTPEGPYSPGVTQVTVAGSSGAKCTARITVTPCPIQCQAATVPAGSDCTAALSPDFVIADSVGPSLQSLILDPAAPHGVGTRPVTVTADYGGGVTSEPATCSVTVTPPASSTLAIAPQHQCMYRSMAVTRQHCFPMSKLVIFTGGACSGSSNLNLEMTAVCGAGTTTTSSSSSGDSTGPTVRAGTGGGGSGGAHTMPGAGLSHNINSKGDSGLPWVIHGGLRDSSSSSKLRGSGTGLRGLLQANPTAEQAFEALAITDAAASLPAPSSSPLESPVTPGKGIPGAAGAQGDVSKSTSTSATPVQATIAAALARSSRTTPAKAAAAAAAASSKLLNQPSAQVLAATNQLRQYRSPGWFDQLIKKRGADGKRSSSFLYTHKGRWFRSMLPGTSYNPPGGNPGPRQPVSWPQPPSEPPSDSSTSGCKVMPASTGPSSNGRVCVTLGPSSAPMHIVTATVTVSDVTSGAKVTATARITVWNEPTGRFRPMFVPSYCIDASYTA